MAEEEAQAAPADAAPAAGGGGSGIVGKILGILLPTIFAGAAGFGGAFLGAPKHAAPADAHAKPDEKKTPGVTIELKAFVLNVLDEKNAEPHHAKITLAVELAKEIPPEQFNTYIPRVRDATLTYLRNLSFQEVANPKVMERISSDVLDRVHKLGAEFAVKVLVQEIVLQ